MEIHATELPGIGKRFEIELETEDQIIVIIHKTGQREIFYRSSPNHDAEELVELTDEKARLLGSILIGGFYQPITSDVPRISSEENTTIEWQTLHESSPLIGQSIEQAALREQTGVTVLAVQRGEEVFSNPDPSFEFEAEDTLVTIGTLEDQNNLDNLLEE
ncbi:cation:proton antiporter regulatory subunit [Halalkalicoccus salilacus]|uniref:cation:proton antiporter regulatory subunit n=1 Tax=Halalkalicoccus salilacus TaxID=3117459 RepID=UPI00300E7F45